MIAHAQSAENVARGFLATFNQAILYPLITLMLTIALVVFLFGAFQFIAGAGSEGVREKGRRHLLWGIIGMLVMISAYAILSIAAGTFGVDVPQ